MIGADAQKKERISKSTDTLHPATPKKMRRLFIRRLALAGANREAGRLSETPEGERITVSTNDSLSDEEQKALEEFWANYEYDPEKSRHSIRAVLIIKLSVHLSPNKLLAKMSSASSDLYKALMILLEKKIT